MKKKIKLGFSSHLGKILNDKFAEHVLSTVGVPCDVVCYENYGTNSLSEVYNAALKDFNCDDETIVVFCHNDIEFKTMNWGVKLLYHFNQRNYSIIGVAGTSYLSYTATWWDDPTKMIGIVDHSNGLRTWTTNFSPKEYFGVKDAVVIDGLFLSFDPKEIVHKFDEDFKGFHFYDLGFVFPNYLEGCNVGVVTDIRILHQSVGITNVEWDKNRQIFANKYSAELPCTYEK